jgi:thiol-disulfide isomerase/thioredoxin
MEHLMETVSEHPWVVIDYYGKHCGPCKQLSPLLAQLAQCHPHIKVVKVDTARIQDPNIMSLPTVLLLGPGQGRSRLQDRLIGYNPAALQAMFSRVPRPEHV